jgi:MFS transporter, DHA3 family, macrolide efflux protein
MTLSLLLPLHIWLSKERQQTIVRMILRLYRNFRMIWIGQVVSVVGDGMQRVALLWWARQTGGNGLLTAVALSTMIPVIACSPLGGWLADRYDRRVLMMSADIARVVVTATLSVLVLTHHSNAVLLCVLVAVSAVATAVFDPTYSATVPSLIPKEHRQAANGLNMANSAVGGLVGPLIGGVLIASFGVGTVLVVNAVTFVWSAAFVAMSHLPRPAGATPDAKQECTTRAAVGGVLRDRQLRRLVGLASVLNMIAAPVPLLVVALAVDRFHAGAASYGLLEVMVSAGILIGALSAAKFAGSSIAPPMLLTGVCLGIAGLLPFAASATVFVIGGAAIALANTALITRFQNSVRAEVQGRVFGVVGALGEALRPAGLALGAPLLAIVGVSGAFVVIGGGVIMATLAWGLPIRGASAVPAGEMTTTEVQASEVPANVA